MKTLFSLLVLFAGIHSYAQSNNRLVSNVDTTIAGLKVNESGEGQIQDMVVFANSDNRRITIDGSKVDEIKKLIAASENGWEVRIKLNLSYDNFGTARNLIESVEILSTENKLTSRGRRSETAPVEALVTKSSAETRKVFDLLYKYEERYYDVNDNCFNRAHFWARSTEINQSLNGIDAGTDKVFIFFSDAYQRKFKHKWWYHVAPVIYQGERKTPYVMDPTFVSDRALTLKQWLQTFDGHTSGNCTEISSLDDYYANSDKPVCMYAVGNMYSYVPTDLDYEPLDGWRCSDFRALMRYSAPGSKPKSTSNSKNISWTDSSFSEILPTHCRR